MLVLSRKRGEMVRIGRDVTITVVEIRGDKVRLGINAPDDVPIHREEIYQIILEHRGELCVGGKNRPKGKGLVEDGKPKAEAPTARPAADGQ